MRIDNSISIFSNNYTPLFGGGGGGGYSYPLDTYDAEVFYSIRLGSSTYSGALLRIRRDSDNAEKDFYPDTSNVLSMSSEDGSGTSLSSWIGSDSGYVTTWYNQGNLGSGYDSSIASSTQQPKIVNSGTLITENGFAALEAVDGGLVMNTSKTWNNHTFFGVQRIDGASSDATFLMPFTSTDSTTDYIAAASSGSSAAPSQTYGSPNYYADGTQIVSATRGTIYSNLCDNSQHLFSVTGGGFSSNRKFRMQYSTLTIQFNAPSNMQEFWHFDSDESANRANIENEINTFYSIY